MEYMASGTAVLTTRLPGMPEEYFYYVYFFDNETREGMAATLKNVTAKTQVELNEMGRRAKAFVITEKNNIKQAKKLMDFITNIKRG
jgi:glycosyltransferase involved in cell wall biosynthesis